jgi:hypothetical protein
MADTKISALANAAALGGGEKLPGVQSGGNVGITPAQIRTYVLTGLAAGNVSGLAAVATSGSAADLTGTIPAGSIGANAISDTKLRDSAALSVIGRSANSSGDPADIAAATDGAVLRRSGTSIGFGALAANAGSGLGTGAFVNVSVGTVAPSSPSANDLWVDTN